MSKLTVSIPDDLHQKIREELEKQGIRQLPVNLHEAYHAFQKDSLVQKTLGRHICEKYVEFQRAEWMDYSRQVSSWELDNYLYRL